MQRFVRTRKKINRPKNFDKMILYCMQRIPPDVFLKHGERWVHELLFNRFKKFGLARLEHVKQCEICKVIFWSKRTYERKCPTHSVNHIV